MRGCPPVTTPPVPSGTKRCGGGVDVLVLLTIARHATVRESINGAWSPVTVLNIYIVRRHRRAPMEQWPVEVLRIREASFPGRLVNFVIKTAGLTRHSSRR